MARIYHIGPPKTPFIIQGIVLLTALLSFVTICFQYFAPELNVKYFLSLTADAFLEGYVWQFFTSLFLVPSLEVSPSAFLHLVFNCYLLWVVSTAIMQRASTSKFIILTSILAIAALIPAWILIAMVYPFYLFSANSGILFGFLICWALLNTDAKLFLFFSIPFNLKYLVLFFLGLTLALDLSYGDFVSFTSYLCCSAASYFFTVIFWGGRSGFPFSRRFEARLARFSGNWRVEKKQMEPEEDEASKLDTLLAKVSEKGEKSLSRKEREWLRKFSQRKKKP